MTQVATSWLVYRLTDSAWLLGLVGFASQIPTLVLIPLGGIIGDRWNRHQILLVAQILGMLQSLALTWLALSGTINIQYIAIIGVLQGFGASICITGSILFMQQISTFRDLIRLNLRTEGA
ncbi:MFS transporter [Nostoc sp.]|uniref:MFS transporter n=1 Tax=Nostoc sp. TaxID=1180 RepID=UPI002FFC5339